MIIGFEVSGYASIKDKISLNFAAEQRQKLVGTRYESNYFYPQRIAKSIALFGANATGKTNILKSLNQILNIISKGLDIKKESFFINSSVGNTHYLITIQGFKKDQYQYELKFDKDKILFEALRKNDILLYEFYNNIASFYLDNDYEKILSVESQNTILNKVKDNKIPEISDFHNALDYYSYSDSMNWLDAIADYDKVLPFAAKTKERFEKNKNIILDILSMVDKSITDFSFIDIKDNRYSLIVKRDDVEFAFERESTGVKKIIELMDNIVHSLLYGGVLIIDELDSSISTISLIKILNGVINSSENKKAQFVISSHNPLIFDTDMLAPAQIYIVGKHELNTTLNALSTYDLRNDKRKVYLNYLRGDYE
ncbi:AAA family ATPase [Campylobacter sp. MOP51]|uniref:AAA family ATPase n=1 Tax=Campylobacter canis TaxID=3378588 RepID=UPI003C6601DF